MTKAIAVNESGKMLEIASLGSGKIITLEHTLTEAINNKKQIRVHVNLKEPEEIIKGTYVARVAGKRGYACSVQFPDKDELDWVCEPPI